MGFGDILEARRYKPAAAGLLHGLALASYPSVAAPALVFFCLYFYLAGRSFTRALLYAGGLGLVLAGLALALLGFGLGNVLDSLRYTGGKVGGGLAKLKFIVRCGLLALAYAPHLVALAAAALFLSWRRSRHAGYALAALPLAALPLYDFGRWYAPGFHTWSSGVIFYLGLLSPLFFYAARGRGGARPLFVAVTLPSLAAGAVVAYTSSMGYINAAVGLLPAALTGLAFLFLAAEGGARRLAFATAAAALAALFAWQQLTPYRDGPRGELTAAVEEGPYAGLYTTPRRAEWLSALSRDLSRAAAPGDGAIFFSSFPAGYLLTGLRPAAPLLWTLPGDMAYALKEMERSGPPPLVVEVAPELGSPPGPELAAFLASSGYQPLIRGEGYTIYRRP